MARFQFAAIADDFTGGSDLAGMLFDQGVRTAQVFGVPDAPLVSTLESSYDAAVVCVKTRSIDPDEACSISLAAYDALEPLRPAQVQFKYCSTFDSTPVGNIGPVTDALLLRMGETFTIAVPALPVNGRTQYQGHLFVLGVPLSESPMRHHPLNPMTDNNLVRYLQHQTTRRVGLVALPAVLDGPRSIANEYQRLMSEGVEIALVDAATDRDLDSIAEASAQLRLITGGSGLAMKLPDAWRRRGLLTTNRAGARRSVKPANGALILSGSCSSATLAQLEHLEKSGCAVARVDVDALMRDASREVDRLVYVAEQQLRSGGVAAIRSSAAATDRNEDAAGALEAAFGEIARLITAKSLAGRVIVAGGETSGAVVNALGIRAVEITGIIDPGVPSLVSIGDQPLALALKSGNFGAVNFFEKTMRLWEQLERA